jgi:hypothetical protein
MRQRPENFNPADGDPEATLATPRFDDDEARRAHPVVPLAEARAHAPYAGAHARRGPRRSWPPALLAVALLAAVAVGAVASMVLRRTPSSPPAAVAPAQAADAPAQVEPPAAEPAPREVADTRPEPPAPSDAQARSDEAAPVRARDEGGRDDREGFEDEDRRGRERDREREKERERRRERREDKAEAEKEMRKVLKRARDKAPRLVDVIVKPGN